MTYKTDLTAIALDSLKVADLRVLGAEFGVSGTRAELLKGLRVVRNDQIDELLDAETVAAFRTV